MPKAPDVLIFLDEGIPTLVHNTTGCTVEIRDFTKDSGTDKRLKKDTKTGEKYYPYFWKNGRVDK